MTMNIAANIQVSGKKTTTLRIIIPPDWVIGIAADKFGSGHVRVWLAAEDEIASSSRYSSGLLAMTGASNVIPDTDRESSFRFRQVVVLQDVT